MQSHIVLMIVAYIAPIVYALLGAPLILKWIPPNAFYGFRIAPAFDSPDMWYLCNRIGGAYLSASGLICLLVNFVLLRLTERENQVVTIVVVNSIIVMAAVGAGVIHARR